MKLVTAIVNGKDANIVCESLTVNGFFFTRIATSGGFLKAKNITLMICTEDKSVNSVLEIIRENCSQRKETVSVIGNMSTSVPTTFNTEVVVGGATVFITDVVHFEKV